MNNRSEILTQQNNAREKTNVALNSLRAIMQPQEVFSRRERNFRADVSTKLTNAFGENSTHSDRMLTLSWIAMELLKEIWPDLCGNSASLLEASNQLCSVNTLVSTAANSSNLTALQEMLLYALYYGSGVAGRVLILLLEKGFFASKSGSVGLPFDSIDIAYLQLKNHQEFYRDTNKEVRLAQFLPVYSGFEHVLSSQLYTKQEIVWSDLNETLLYISALLPVDQYHLGKLSDFIQDPQFLNDNNMSDPHHLLSIIRARNLMYMQRLAVNMFELEVAKQEKKQTDNSSALLKMFRRNSAPDVMQSVTQIGSPTALSGYSNLFGVYTDHLIQAIMSDLFYFGKTRVLLLINQKAYPVTMDSLLAFLGEIHTKIARSIGEDTSNYYAQYVSSSLFTMYDQITKLQSLQKSLKKNERQDISIENEFTSRLSKNYDAALIITYLTWMKPFKPQETKLQRFYWLIDTLQKQKMPENDKDCAHGRLIDLLKMMLAMEGDRTALQSLSTVPFAHPILRRQEGVVNEDAYNQLVAYINSHAFGMFPDDWQEQIKTYLQAIVNIEHNPEIAYFLEMNLPVTSVKNEEKTIENIESKQEIPEKESGLKQAANPEEKAAVQAAPPPPPPPPPLSRNPSTMHHQPLSTTVESTGNNLDAKPPG